MCFQIHVQELLALDSRRLRSGGSGPSLGNAASRPWLSVPRRFHKWESGSGRCKDARSCISEIPPHENISSRGLFLVNVRH